MELEDTRSQIDVLGEVINGTGEREKAQIYIKSWRRGGLNDIRDGPASRRAPGRGTRIRGLRLRTSDAAGP